MGPREDPGASPKTEHHERKGNRLLPLFRELRAYLQAALDELLADFDPKASRLSEQPVIAPHREHKNLGTEVKRVIKKAGLTAWPKVWHNMRATRHLELQEDFPRHVVCAWLGNSERVATKHYLQVTNAHFDQATAPTAAQHGPELTMHRTETSLIPSKSSENREVLIHYQWAM